MPSVNNNIFEYIENLFVLVSYFHLGPLSFKHVLCYFVMNIPFTCFRFVKREHLTDVAEVFRVLNAEKKYRIEKLAL